MDTYFLAFLAISVAVIVVPGPDTALTIRNTFLGGRHGGISTAFGVSMGQIVWSLATSLGLVAVLMTSELVFQVLKFLGAAYLIYLGIQSLRYAFRGLTNEMQNETESRSRLSGVKGFRQGMISNLANPKMAVFFASVLPQFAPSGNGVLSTFLLLGVVFSVLTFIWLGLYAVIIPRTSQFMQRSSIRRFIDCTAGTALIALGLKLATDNR